MDDAEPRGDRGPPLLGRRDGGVHLDDGDAGPRRAGRPRGATAAGDPTGHRGRETDTQASSEPRSSSFTRPDAPASTEEALSGAQPRTLARHMLCTPNTQNDVGAMAGPETISGVSFAALAGAVMVSLRVSPFWPVG